MAITTGQQVTGWRNRPAAAVAVAELLRTAAQEGEHAALVFPGARVTYPQLEQRADAAARALHGLGIGRGDTVAIFMGNGPEYVVSLLAAAKLGAVAVPVNGRFKARELRHVIAHSDSQVLLTAVNDGPDEEYARVLAEVFPELARADPQRFSSATAPGLRTIVNLGARSVDGMLGADRFAAAGAEVDSGRVDLLQSRVRIRDPALLMYTSGTTALPKGCVITHEAIVRQAMAAGERAFGLSPGESFWNPLPLFHTGGLMPLIASLHMRTAFCHPGHFEPGAALAMIERERCAVLYVMFDTIWVPVLDHPRFAESDLSHVRALYLVGPPDRMRWYQDRTPEITVVSAFGMTEICTHLAVAGRDADETTRLTTAGHVQPELEAQIIDPVTGEPLAPGTPGELLYRGPFLFEGYHKQPELTAEAIDATGWFHSGDLGELDEQGRFTFRGRLKDMLKVGGENVSPLEIEAQLVQHPAVAIAQVVSAPDARYAEVPAAYVQLRDGATATEQQLIDHCRGTIATYKVPRYVRFVEEWPMSGTKIQKFALRERIAAELREQGIAEAPRVSSTVAGRQT